MKDEERESRFVLYSQTIFRRSVVCCRKGNRLPRYPFLSLVSSKDCCLTCPKLFQRLCFQRPTVSHHSFDVEIVTVTSTIHVHSQLSFRGSQADAIFFVLSLLRYFFTISAHPSRRLLIACSCLPHRCSLHSPRPDISCSIPSRTTLPLYIPL